ncbi:MAG: hypothetical protein ACRCST_04245 [Turicibacter sp.]
METSCQLCNRTSIPLTKHHLLPREEGGKEEHIAIVCCDCHRQIHALYTNKELAVRLNSIESLKMDDKFSKFLTFIKKQPSSKKMRVIKSKEVRKK